MTSESLCRYLSRLQEFANYEFREDQLAKEFMLSIYTAIRFCLKHVRLSYLGYVITKLELDKDQVSDEQDIVSELVARAEALSQLEFVSSAVVDDGLRALMEIVDTGQAALNGAELRKIAELLEPLATKRDEEIRLRLHSPVQI
jgi:hypothetical protein